MKKKDIGLIVAVVIFSGMLSFFVSRTLFTSPKDLQTEVEVVEPISADFKQPDKRYFNENSINPTIPITIGDDQNTKPFPDAAN